MWQGPMVLCSSEQNQNTRISASAHAAGFVEQVFFQWIFLSLFDVVTYRDPNLFYEVVIVKTKPTISPRVFLPAGNLAPGRRLLDTMRFLLSFSLHPGNQLDALTFRPQEKRFFVTND